MGTPPAPNMNPTLTETSRSHSGSVRTQAGCRAALGLAGSHTTSHGTSGTALNLWVSLPHPVQWDFVSIK